MKPSVAQWIAAMTANLAMLSSGMLFGWASPSLPKLLRGEDQLKITSDEGAWIISFLSFGSVFGPLLPHFAADRIGRKWTLKLVALPILTCWAVLGLATNVETLYVGRFIGGLGMGATYGVMPMYLGEIAEDNIRGALGTLMLTMLNLGMLLSFSSGPWVSRQILSVISVVPPLLFLLIFFWMPETPYYLLMKGKRDEATASLIWLRQKFDVAEELRTLEENVRKQQDNGKSISELIKSPGNRKAVFFTAGLLTIHQFSGVVAIQSYASMIFEESNFDVPSSISVIIMGLVKIVAGVCAFFAVDVAGRKPMLMLSAMFTSVFLAFEGAFFHLKHLDMDTSFISWIPLVGILGFYMVYTMGLGSLPYTVIGEVFPTNVKASATMILSMYGSALAMIISKLYQIVTDEFGAHCAFYGFSVFTMTGVAFVYFCVPETKRRSLQDIQDDLNNVSSGEIVKSEKK